MATNSGSFSGSKAKLFVLAGVAVAGLAAWVMLSGPSDAEDQSGLGPVVATAPASPAPGEAAEAAAALPAETVPAALPVEGLKISSQSWRRGGLGSKALVTFTLRNANDYAVKDIEITCAFTRRDGRHLTDRRRLIPDTVGTKARKTFARLHVGFVNVNANKAKCLPIAASRI